MIGRRLKSRSSASDKWSFTTKRLRSSTFFLDELEDIEECSDVPFRKLSEVDSSFDDGEEDAPVTVSTVSHSLMDVMLRDRIHPAVLQEIKQVSEHEKNTTQMSSWGPHSPFIKDLKSSSHQNSPRANSSRETEKFNLAFDELISTERSFGRKIDCLHLVFSESLRAYNETTFEEPIASVNEIDRLFMNVSSLRDSVWNLYEDLRDIQSRGELLTERLRDVFLLSEFRLLEQFGEYCLGFDYAHHLYKDLMGKSPRFRAFIKRAEYVSKTKFSALLLEPVQRLTRYSILIKEMQKYASPADVLVLESSRNIVENVSLRINELLVEQSSKHMVHVLEQKLFKGKISLVEPDRKCLRFSFLLSKNISKSSHVSQSKEYFFILFSDMLVYAQLSRDKRSGTLKHCLPLTSMSILDEELSDFPATSKQKFVFVIRTPQKSLLLSAPTQQCKTEWISALRNACNDTKLFENVQRADELERTVGQPSTRREGRPILSAECPWISEKGL